jgi:hypothetical protein
MKKNIVFIFLVILIINQVIFFSCRKDYSCTEYKAQISTDAREWMTYSDINRLIFKNLNSNIKDTLILAFQLSGIKWSNTITPEMEHHDKCPEHIIYFDVYTNQFNCKHFDIYYSISGSIVHFGIDSVNYNFNPSNITLDTARINNILYYDVYKSNNIYISKTYGILKFEYNDSLYELVR